MVHSSTFAITTDGERLTYGGFSHGETVHFENLEFIASYFGSLSLSSKGSDSGDIFVGMAHNGSLTLRTVLKDFTNEFYTTSIEEESSDFPISPRRIMGTQPTPIATTPWPKDALTPQTMAMVPPRTIVMWMDTRFPPYRWHTFWEGQ
jgi:hypothetical protein